MYHYLQDENHASRVLRRADPDVPEVAFAGGLPNVYLGVTVENQDAAKRIAWLMATPAAKRFVCLEPLLESVNLRSVEVSDHGYWRGKTYVDALIVGWTSYLYGQKNEKKWYQDPIDQVIVGGESGPNARPMHPDWVRSIRDQCNENGVPLFFKQWGNWIPMEQTEPGDVKPLEITMIGQEILYRVRGKAEAGRKLDGREYNEFPKMKEVES